MCEHVAYIPWMSYIKNLMSVYGLLLRVTINVPFYYTLVLFFWLNPVEAVASADV